MSKKLVPHPCSVKLLAPSAVKARHSCENCGFCFSSNPLVPHGYTIGPGKRRGTKSIRFICWCSCGGIELEHDDGTIAAIYHHAGCAAGECASSSYERERTQEQETLEQLALRELWMVGL